MSVLLKNEIFEIKENEGKEIATAVKNVLSQYDMTPNPRVMAWSQLVGVLVAVYGPKLAILALTAKIKKQQAQQNAQPQTPPNFTVQPEMNGKIKFN